MISLVYQRIVGVAHSKDGIQWTRHSDQPIFTNSNLNENSSWDGGNNTS